MEKIGSCIFIAAQNAAADHLNRVGDLIDSRQQHQVRGQRHQLRLSLYSSAIRLRHQDGKDSGKYRQADPPRPRRCGAETWASIAGACAKAGRRESATAAASDKRQNEHQRAEIKRDLVTSDVNDPERGDQQRDDGKQSDFKEQRARAMGSPSCTSRNRTAKSGPLSARRSGYRASVRARRTHHSMLANITQ